MKVVVAPPAIAAVLAVAALAVPGAEAQTRAPAATTTETRLQQTRVALAQASAELARIRKELETPHARVRRLERMLSQAASQLRAAQAQLAASPTPLAVAEAQVAREVGYARLGVPFSEGQLVSEAAMDYVAGHVSATAYGYLELTGAPLPPFGPDGTLTAQAGICGNAAVAFAAIVQHFGFASRSVSFYYDDPVPADTPDGHVGVEVLYDGAWHFFDPTFGLFWTDASGDVLPIADVRSGLGTLQKNAASFTNVVEDAELGNDTWFETDPTTQVVVGAWTRLPS